jgi:hypothetical protein
MNDSFSYLSNLSGQSAAFDTYIGAGDYAFDNSDYGKQQSGFDNYAQYPTEVFQPEQFDFEIDTSLAAFDAELQGLPIVDHDNIFHLLRTDTPTRGVPSTFTVSSESVSGYDSGFDSLSAHSESIYNYSPNPAVPSSILSAQQEIDMDLQRLGITTDDRTYSMSSPTSNYSSSPGSIAIPRGSFSDYEPAVRIRIPTSSASEYYPSQLPLAVSKYQSTVAQATVSPANVTQQLPTVSQHLLSGPQQRVTKSESGITSMSKDPKRKYQCPTCPRAFARAYNLKTHIQTHDPNRSKPYACHHKSCGRSFSRKHDLTRHLISIHRSDVDGATAVKAVGVERGNRVRCDDCGKSWVDDGKSKGCDCDDVK